MTNIPVHMISKPDDRHYEYLLNMLASSIQITTGDEVPDNTRILIAGRPSEVQLTASDELEALLIPFAGLPDTTRELLIQYPNIRVHNLHFNAELTAEMAFTLMLTCSRQIIPLDQALRRNDWSARYHNIHAVLLKGKTALILGYGEIGKHVGHLCSALGMKIIGIRRRQDEADANVYSVEHLHHLLPQAQVLFVCLPLTQATENMIGEKEIRLLPEHSILINVGRAKVVDEQALYSALLGGHLHSAGLDVWYRYPKDASEYESTPPANLPFNELPNVVMSPHRSAEGASDDVQFMRMASIAETLNAFAEGKGLLHPVDLEEGY